MATTIIMTQTEAQHLRDAGFNLEETDEANYVVTRDGKDATEAATLALIQRELDEVPDYTPRHVAEDDEEFVEQLLSEMWR